jgi:hypothetical protein
MCHLGCCRLACHLLCTHQSSGSSCHGHVGECAAGEDPCAQNLSGTRGIGGSCVADLLPQIIQLVGSNSSQINQIKSTQRYSRLTVETMSTEVFSSFEPSRAARFWACIRHLPRTKRHKMCSMKGCKAEANTFRFLARAKCRVAMAEGGGRGCQLRGIGVPQEMPAQPVQTNHSSRFHPLST